jgi:hypothetical protein
LPLLILGRIANQCWLKILSGNYSIKKKFFQKKIRFEHSRGSAKILIFAIFGLKFRFFNRSIIRLGLPVSRLGLPVAWTQVTQDK